MDQDDDLDPEPEDFDGFATRASDENPDDLKVGLRRQKTASANPTVAINASAWSRRRSTAEPHAFGDRVVDSTV